MNGQSYSRDTFKDFAKDRHYVSVRIKQGVPLVDADINESDDLRRYELRSFLRWFVGAGAPHANSGFRIMPSGKANDVIIMGGDNTSEGSGRCLVDGMEVLNPGDISFSEQEFRKPAAAAAAHVSQVTMPITPTAEERVDLYYLDVWEREISSAEVGHEDIMDKRIGIESARRIRREWAVRVRDDVDGLPANNDPPDHRYLALARVFRTPGQEIIPAEAIVDLRRRGIQMPTRTTFDQITADAFGSSYALTEDGTPKLALPLRDVINAMLRDGRPAIVGPTRFQEQNGPHNFPTSTIDATGNQWVFWLGASSQVFFQRQLGGVWTPPAAAFVATGESQQSLATVSTRNGSIWLFYSARVDGESQVLLRRFINGAWEQTDTTVSDQINNVNPVAAVDSAGNVMVAWLRDDAVMARPFIDITPQAIVTAATGDPVPARIALLPGARGSFDLYTVDRLVDDGDWPVETKAFQGGTWSDYSPVGTISVSSFVEFTVVRDSTTSIWLIWTTQLGGDVSVLRARRITQGAQGDVFLWDKGSPRAPSALSDLNQNVQVFYRNDTHLDRINVVFSV